MIWTYHQSIDLAWALGQKRFALHEMLTTQGVSLSSGQLRRKLQDAQAQGYLVLPICDKVDPRGFCTGHRIPSLAEEETDA